MTSQSQDAFESCGGIFTPKGRSKPDRQPPSSPCQGGSTQASSPLSQGGKSPQPRTVVGCWAAQCEQRGLTAVPQLPRKAAPSPASSPSREAKAAGDRSAGTGMLVAPSHSFPFSQKAWKPKVKEVGGNSARHRPGREVSKSAAIFNSAALPAVRRPASTGAGAAG